MTVWNAQVDVKTPKGKVLARQLSMKVEAGHSLLVTGPNGSGKSSIIRYLIYDRKNMLL